MNQEKSLVSTDAIVQALRTEIWQGILQSGQPLRQDELAARFGVSKIPLREALFQLKAEGLVTFYPNRGAVVSALSADEVDEIYVMRIALESAALQRAIPKLTIANLGRAEQILAALDDEQNTGRWSDFNWEFHAALYAPADLPRLMEWIKTLHNNIARYLVLYLACLEYQVASQAEHRQILQACRQGDVQAALGHLQDHMDSASQQLSTFLRQRQPAGKP